MKRAFLFLPFYFFIFTLPCYGQPVSSRELINNARAYDGRTIMYAGEVIGEIMARGKHAWLNINDGNLAIGVWVPKALLKDISYTGNYKSIGDWVEIVGVFCRSCAEHGGDLDIHAVTLRKINSGRPIQDRLSSAKRNFALALLGTLCLVLILRQFKRL